MPTPHSAYDKRRQPPMDTYRHHRPVPGGAGHLRPDEARVLEEWANELQISDDGTHRDIG
ncbi:hypothetical protein AB0D57_23075 [Streptomyces sp. NPDC048275]|uniref:hypothetical protein n=1 Tax=Streptomyces sp. NPDC048275 TaxID=3155629 RepID=UPI0033E388D8